jgi:hypothetical protein
MENVRARQKEAMFYALEQQSLRARKDTPRSVWAASHLYHLTVSYGQSFVRPLGWLLWVKFVSFCIYAAFGSISLWAHLVDFTIEQLVRPLSVWLPTSEESLHKLFGKNLLVLLGIKIIATFQSIFSLSLLALFLLALRRRFKMG